jgi:hypothetical protein
MPIFGFPCLLHSAAAKREYFKYPRETIGDFAPAGANFGARRSIANSQRPAIGGHFSAYRGKSLHAPDWLAGDAVLIAPVSKQIPWYQGILQGILRFWGLETRFSTKKPLRCSHFSSNSLRKLTGKIFQETGNF